MTKSRQVAVPGPSQVLLDTLMGLGLYVALCILMFGSQAKAAFEAAFAGQAPQHWLAFAIIGLAFAGVFAFNAAVVRHLRRVYATEASRRRRSSQGDAT